MGNRGTSKRLFSLHNYLCNCDLRSRRPATGVSRALQARVSRECPRECPRKRECPTECPTGCLQSVQKVFRECPHTFFDTPGTLSGHFLDILEPRARRAPAHPVGHSVGHPRFRGHSPGHSGPKGPRDPCSWSAGSQIVIVTWREK